MIKTIIFFLLLVAHLPVSAALRVVAAENVYGELAKIIGGEFVEVRSILNNTTQDPHLFSATPGIAKAVAKADLVIYNGLGYDDWMRKLVSVSSKSVIVVADLTSYKTGENPHLWYDPTVMPKLAQKLTDEFIAQDPKNQKIYEKNLQVFTTDYQRLTQRIQDLKKDLQGVSVLVTESLFDYMGAALGLKMQVLNSASPGPRELKHMEDAIKQRHVKFLIYNTQVNQPLVNRLRELAYQKGIPTVGVTETQPVGVSYIQWMGQQLELLE
ncbi:MAG: metal ABC transporter solute-binding protein, Zn/Mn family [Gammaproteobacteria bacterium]